jgi:hypothetical protein
LRLFSEGLGAFRVSCVDIGCALMIWSTLASASERFLLLVGKLFLTRSYEGDSIAQCALGKGSERDRNSDFPLHISWDDPSFELCATGDVGQKLIRFVRSPLPLTQFLSFGLVETAKKSTSESFNWKYSHPDFFQLYFVNYA